MWLSGRSASCGLGGVVGSSVPDGVVLSLGSDRMPVTTEAVARRLLWLAGGGAAAGIVAVTALALAEGAYWLAAIAPVVGIVAAVTLPAGARSALRYPAPPRRAGGARRAPPGLPGAPRP